MVNPSRKVTPKSSENSQPDIDAIKSVSPKTPSIGQIVAIAILLSGAALVIATTWISILFFLNPEQVIWLNQVLPEWAQIPLGESENPQTVEQIQIGLSQKQQMAGENLPLDDDKSFLLPVFRLHANCQSDCREVIELRVYQLSREVKIQSHSEKYYRLATRLPITGPEENEAIASLVDTKSENPDASNPLSLTEVKRFEGKTPSSGVWFYLRGQRQQGNNAIAYGQIVYYNPERTNLQQMLSWTNPNGQPPKWQQVTGSSAKELVIDQTVGLEPQLQVYQVKPLKLYLNPIQLELISLKPAVLKNATYQNALLVAQSGLWTPALESLQFIKKQQRKTLPAAQAQIDVIRLHAQLTKVQADKTWASPSQQVLADLIDGRWEKALDVFTASPQNVQEITTLLKADKGRLWNRTVAALRVNPNRREVQAWGALILAVQQGEERANTWLQEQPGITKANLTYIQSLLKQLTQQ